MKIKLISLAILGIVSTSNAYNGYTREHSNYEKSNVSQFERGFTAAINMLDREARAVELKYEEVPNKYIVYLDIRKMPKEHILVAKNYAFKEGYYPIVTRSKMILGGVDRVSDAKHIIKLMGSKYFRGKKLDYKRNTKKVYSVYNFLFKDLFRIIKQNSLYGAQYKNKQGVYVFDDLDTDKSKRW